MNLRKICAISKRLKGIIVGPNDLLKDLKALESKGQEALLTSYGLCLLAARAYGLICIDGVYKQFADAAGFAENCAMGRVLGFDGKSLIHPAQIAPANAAFGPSETDIDLAKRQVQAFEAASAQGKGVAVVDGALVEGLHVESAHDLLKMAKAIAKREGS
jgi:citrate lyase beta subunit